MSHSFVGDIPTTSLINFLYVSRDRPNRISDVLAGLSALLVSPIMPQGTLSSLPCDLHGLVYSYLEWKEKMSFILVSKEITSLSRSYREMRINRGCSVKYVDPYDDVLRRPFRDCVYSLVMPCHVELNLSLFRSAGLLTDEYLRHLGNLQSLNLSESRGFTDAGLAYLGDLKKINLSSCQQITDEGLRHS
jgi:hypothetical protein